MSKTIFHKVGTVALVAVLAAPFAANAESTLCDRSRRAEHDRTRRLPDHDPEVRVAAGRYRGRGHQPDHLRTDRGAGGSPAAPVAGTGGDLGAGAVTANVRGNGGNVTLGASTLGALASGARTRSTGRRSPRVDQRACAHPAGARERRHAPAPR